VLNLFYTKINQNVPILKLERQQASSHPLPPLSAGSRMGHPAGLVWRAKERPRQLTSISSHSIRTTGKASRRTHKLLSILGASKSCRAYEGQHLPILNSNEGVVQSLICLPC